MTKYRTAVLFGGAGFVGSHFARHLIDHDIAQHVVIVDIKAPKLPNAIADRISYVDADVRQELLPSRIAARPDLIVNLAAIHREPGHEAHEYFETNVGGAENVTRYATLTECKLVVFVSSISVYGPTEEEKDEAALPVPTSPYGASKLVAEHIHQGWQLAAPADRRLLIVRPGVVFGPGEGGNVTRLVRAVCSGLFVYCGNHHVRKAGGYVKELNNVCLWGIQLLQDRGFTTLTLNFTEDPTPRLDQFVNAIAQTAGRRPPRLSVPYLPMLAASHVLSAVAALIKVEQPLPPVRARKLVRSNHISSRVLREHGYLPRFSLLTALADWKAFQRDDWR